MLRSRVVAAPPQPRIDNGGPPVAALLAPNRGVIGSLRHFYTPGFKPVLVRQAGEVLHHGHATVVTYGLNTRTHIHTHGPPVACSAHEMP